MTIIVTGDAGFIGSATILYLIKKTGHTIVNVDMLTYAGHLESLGPVVHVLNYHFERVEIRDAEKIRDIFNRCTTSY